MTTVFHFWHRSIEKVLAIFFLKMHINQEQFWTSLLIDWEKVLVFSFEWRRFWNQITQAWLESECNTLPSLAGRLRRYIRNETDLCFQFVVSLIDQSFYQSNKASFSFSTFHKIVMWQALHFVCNKCCFFDFLGKQYFLTDRWVRCHTQRKSVRINFVFNWCEQNQPRQF